MTRAYRFVLLALLLGLSASLMGVAWAQSPPATGTPAFGSFGGGPEVINLANNNVHWDVPVLAKAGRGGFNFTYDLSYDSSVWAGGVSSGTSLWYPVGNWGWRGITEASTGYISYTSSTHMACEIWNPDDRRYDKYFYYLYTFYAYGDPFGIPHPLNVTLENDLTGGNCTNDPNLDSYATGTISDGSGYAYSLQVPPSQALEYIYPASGGVIHPPLNSGSGAASGADRNGNQITVNGSGQFFDTMSSTVPALTVTGSGTPTSPMTFTYTAPSGANASYTMKYTAYTVKTNFGCPNISEYGPTSNNLVSEIDLPDGSKYTLGYEATPGYAGDVTGRLASVTLPTGGTISYTYSGGNNGVVCADGSTATLTRTTPDGAWTYAQVKGSGAASTTTVTDPQSNVTTIQFQGIYETQRVVNQGSATVVKNINTCYNGAASPCTSTAIAQPITQKSVLDQYGASGPLCKHVYSYSAFGVPTEIDDYDYPSGTALLRKTTITYATLSNNINVFSQTTTVQNGAGTQVAQTTNTYDEGTPASSSGTPQHVAVSGSRGNLTTSSQWVQGSATLASHVSYYDTGTVSTTTDVNGAVTTYAYPDATSTCGNAFPTSANEPLSLSRSMTWNCTGGVQLTAKDENNQTVTTTYNDPYFWRPNAVMDQASNTTNIGYTGATAVTPYMYLNGNNSIVAVAHNFDGLGRAAFDQRYQSPTAQSFDTVSYTYDANGRQYSTSMPCSVGAGLNCPSGTPKTTQTYDALNRPLVITDGGGGTVSYSYTANDVYVTTGPAPTGENTKRRQLEYDALGRLTSVCEITSASGSGACSQNSPQTGFWTKYAYDALNNLTGVTQNAQGSSQTRSYSFDGMSRLTSETNPESSTKTYVYDSDSTMCGNGAYASAGDLVKSVDAAGNCVMRYYDSLHRATDIGNSNQSVNHCQRFRYDNSSGYPGSTKPAGLTNTLGRLIEAAVDYCGSTDQILSDEWFSYTARGEISDVYESTPNSGGYYHSAATYFANGVPSLLTAPGGYGASFSVDGEGRIYSTPPTVALASTTYNAASQPTQLNFSSSDSDTFTYDPNTGRMTQYKFNVNGQSVVANLTWNANGTLQTQNITDPFNSANTQNCAYGYDDVTRLTSANCGSVAAQTFSYDPFGNISKSGSPFSFQPTYSSATNRITAVGSFTPSYDANGDVTNDNSHTYTWNVDGRPLTIDSVSLTYDAFGRMVEQNRSGVFSQFVYAPTGAKIEIMNGQSVTKTMVPLPGGASIENSSAGLLYHHPDYLGSTRFRSTSSRTMYSDDAYAPFGEPYARAGTTNLTFTRMNQDTVGGLYDFPAREYSIQGRWPSPDPAGSAAVDPSNPQSWNRYAYVLNNPLTLVDPLGLDPTQIFCFATEEGGWTCVWPSDGGGGSGNPPCTVQAVPDPYTELVLAGYGLPEDLMEMAPPQQSRGCGRGGGSNTGGPQPPCLAGAGPLAPGQSRCPAINDPCANATLAAAGVDIQQNIVQAQSTISLGRMMGVTGGSYNHTVGLWAALFNYATLVGTGGPQDVKNHPGPGTSQQRVDAGNISFGVTCSFGGAFCQFAAGLAQTVSGNPNFQGTLKTGFDTPSDNAAIRVGQAMRAAGCHE